MKKLIILSIFLAACGSNSGSKGGSGAHALDASAFPPTPVANAAGGKITILVVGCGIHFIMGGANAEAMDPNTGQSTNLQNGVQNIGGCYVDVENTPAF